MDTGGASGAYDTEVAEGIWSEARKSDLVNNQPAAISRAQDRR